jgi:hypothetical protein
MRFYQCVYISLVAVATIRASTSGADVGGSQESVEGEGESGNTAQETNHATDSRFNSSDQQRPSTAAREDEGRQTSNTDTIPPADLIHTPVNQAQAAEGIAMNEMLFFKQTTSVAQTLSQMGIQGVNMGTHVHVLNTYLDLVQRIMSHLGVIAGAETATKTQIDELIAQMTEVAAFKLSGSAKKQEAAEGEH